MTGKLHRSLYVFILPLCTGILLAVSALPSGFWYISFFALIPLFVAADYSSKTRSPFFNFMLQLFVALVVFYLLVGFWMLGAANAGILIGLMVIVPFLLILTPYISFLKRGSRFAPLYFITAWITVEMVQSFFQLGSPFFNLGHNPGASPGMIQWYCFTGSAGGTLWILVVNFLILSIGRSLWQRNNKWKKQSIITFAVIFLPMVLSLTIYYTYQEKGKPVEVMVVHPATDNTDVKYRVNIYELMDIYLGIILPHITETTEYVVLPETSITNAGWVTDYDRNLVFDHWYRKTAGYPSLKLVTGAITYEAISDVKKIKGYDKITGIRYSQNYKTWYNTYNAALMLEKGRPVQIRVKEGLVPYSEYAPWPRIIPRLAPIGIDFQFSERKSGNPVFKAADNHKTAALICYELVYGRLFSRAARKGAEAFFVLLNEGWYEEPVVSRQFLQLSVIRAVENRRSVAHSSNMGISAFINQRGDIVKKVEKNNPVVLKEKLFFTKSKTKSVILNNYINGIITLLTLCLAFGIIKKKI